MEYSNKWKLIKPLGEGGQGKVYLVWSREQYFDVQSEVAEAIISITSNIVSHKSQKEEAYEKLLRGLPKMMQMQDPGNQFALKVLHEPTNARDPNLAKDRIIREIDTMKNNHHSNLLELVDVDPDYKWYVSKYYPGGTLTNRLDVFKGDFLAALKALRSVVDGIAKLHKEGYVHRDIKPENIFVGANNELILGDFGLVYFEDLHHSRMSATYENVGSRDWMPAWAMGMRIEDIKPTFDVFSLGKVLWAMISGKSILRLWYFDREQFNVECMYPDSVSIKLANPLFKKCIVEAETDCLPNAEALLDEIDKTIATIQSGGDRIDLKVKRKCKVCGTGEYRCLVDENPVNIRNFGINPAGNRAMKIFTCSYCGNVQLFSYDRDTPPPAWS